MLKINFGYLIIYVESVYAKNEREKKRLFKVNEKFEIESSHSKQTHAMRDI